MPSTSRFKNPAGHQIGQKAVNGAHRQPRQRRHLLRGESSRRFAEEMQKPQPALQGGNVVVAFRTYSHRYQAKMKVLDYLMKIGFYATSD